MYVSVVASCLPQLAYLGAWWKKPIQGQFLDSRAKTFFVTVGFSLRAEEVEACNAPVAEGTDRSFFSLPISTAW